MVTEAGGSDVTMALTNGLVTSVTDTDGRVVHYQYNDGNGDLTDVIDVNGGHAQFSYNSAHQLQTWREPNFYGNTTTTPTPVVTNVYNTSGQ